MTDNQKTTVKTWLAFHSQSKGKEVKTAYTNKGVKITYSIK